MSTSSSDEQQLTPNSRMEKKAKEKTVYGHADYDASYSLILSIQWIGGLRLTKNDSKSRRFFWDVFYWIQHMNVWLAIVMDIAYIAVKSTNYGEILQTLPKIGYLVLTLAKSYKMVSHRPVFNNLIRELGDMWPEGPISEEESRLVKNTVRKLKIVVQVYFWCHNVLVTISLIPSFMAVIRRHFGHDAPLVLPYLYWYPFDPFEGGPCFAVALVMECIHAVTAVSFMLMGDLLFCIFLSHLSMQFDLLAMRIRRLIQHSEPKEGFSAYSIQQMLQENYDGPEWERTHLVDLAAIIVRHRALIRLSSDVEEMYSAALLLHFFNSSLIFCFCGFCSVMLEKWNEFIFKSFLITALFQTYLICSYGQRLIDSSKISDALYSCAWYNASKRVKGSILIMLLRSQKEIHITTYGFSVINMACYAKILKTAWSYLSLLLNFTQREE